MGDRGKKKKEKEKQKYTKTKICKVVNNLKSHLHENKTRRIQIQTSP